ncbi:unnamed protein product [Withania somnifera]
MNNLSSSEAEEESSEDSNPAPIIDLQDPWKIKKVITDFEQSSKILVLPSPDIFRHVFRHWLDGMIEILNKGMKQQIILWDLTEENDPRKCGRAYVQKMKPSMDYALVCADLFINHELNDGDHIGLYWDTIACDFKFKLIEKGLF